MIVGGVALTGGRSTVWGLYWRGHYQLISSGLALNGLPQHFGDIATRVLIVTGGWTLDLLMRRAASRSLGY